MAVVLARGGHDRGNVRVRMRRCLQWRGAVAALVLGSVLLGPVSAHAAGLKWATAQIDQQTSTDAPDIDALSCPTAALCVAGDDAGNILTSTNPGGGRAAWSSAAVNVKSKGLPWINGVSCPSTSLCVAAAQSGDVLTSTDPTGGTEAWTRTAVSARTRLTAVACPSISACVAVSGGAQAFFTTSPTGGADSWTGQTIDPGDNLTAVSCPTTTFCAAVDDQGNVLTSPGPSGLWTPTHLTSSALLAVSCNSAALCVAADGGGAIWSSTSPTSGVHAWHRTALTPGAGTVATVCEDPSFCVTGNDGIRYSLNPSDGSTWIAPSDGAALDPNVISCVGTSFCAAASSGDISVSKSPTTGAWSSPAQVDGTPTLYGVSCPRINRCYAGDDSGHILVSRNPTGGAAAWAAPGSVTGTIGTGFYGLACPTISLCVAGRDDSPIGSSGSGGTGGFTTNASGSVGGWKSIPLLHGPDPIVHGFFDAGCAGKSLCAITWDGGALSISTTPTKVRSWKRITSKGQHLGVYCPESGRCVAPGGSCPVRGFCAVLSTVGDGTGNGKLSVSTDPSRGASSWKTLTIDSGHGLTAISCTSARQCVAVDAAGRILTSSKPTTASTWRVARTVSDPLEAISCPSSKLCVAVGANGTAVTGTAGG
jgi:hypothetical protein